MDLDLLITKLILLHESNKDKPKHPVPPLAFMYAEYCREGRKDNEPNLYTFEEFSQIAKSPKEP